MDFGEGVLSFFFINFFSVSDVTAAGLGGRRGGRLRTLYSRGVGVERSAQGRSYENRSIGYSFRLLTATGTLDFAAR